MPVNTNLAFREFGIALFFAAVGLSAGAKFFVTVFSATGLQWLLAGVCVTVLPLLVVGIFARVVLKMNFMGPKRLARRQHDRSARARLRLDYREVGRAIGRICHRLSAYYAHADSCYAGACDHPFPMNTPTLGEPLHVGNYKLADLRPCSDLSSGQSPSLKLALADRLFRAFGGSRQAHYLLVDLIGFITCKLNHIERLGTECKV
jgi:hypothetical protein